MVGLLQVVLPDGTSAKLDDSGEVVTTGDMQSPAGVGSLSLPTTPLPQHSLPPSQSVVSSGHTDPVTGQVGHACCNLAEF